MESRLELNCASPRQLAPQFTDTVQRRDKGKFCYLGISTRLIGGSRRLNSTLTLLLIRSREEQKLRDIKDCDEQDSMSQARTSMQQYSAVALTAVTIYLHDLAVHCDVTRRFSLAVEGPVRYSRPIHFNPAARYIVTEIRNSVAKNFQILVSLYSR